MNLEQAFGNVADKVIGWLNDLILLLPNLVVAVVVAIAFGLVARLVRGLVNRGMNRVSQHRQLNRLLAGICAVAIVLVGTFVALQIIGLDKAVTSMLAGVGILGLALSLAFQSIASSYVAGVLLILRPQFRDGDIIQNGDHTGVVMDMELRTTVIRTFQGQIVYLPNNEVLQSPVVNYSQTGRRRIDLQVGVSYDDDLEDARRIAIQAVSAIPDRDHDSDVDLFYESFGDSSINFTIRFWINSVNQGDYMAARSEAVIRIKRAFDDNDISIPFPIRSLDFGTPGGEMLLDRLVSSSRE